MDLFVRFAEEADAPGVIEVLREGARWMAIKGWPGWTAEDVSPRFVANRIARGEMVAARMHGCVVGACSLSRWDPDFWPEDQPGDAAYVHRLAVRRAHAGGQITPAIVAWCANTAHAWGCAALKLDCHPNIRDIYVRLGFTHRDQRTVCPDDRAPYTVDRFMMSLSR
jgi:GNAT superfamily N-acetyltransferase